MLCYVSLPTKNDYEMTDASDQTKIKENNDGRRLPLGGNNQASPSNYLMTNESGSPGSDVSTDGIWQTHTVV